MIKMRAKPLEWQFLEKTEETPWRVCSVWNAKGVHGHWTIDILPDGRIWDMMVYQQDDEGVVYGRIFGDNIDDLKEKAERQHGKDLVDLWNRVFSMTTLEVTP